MLYFIKLFFSLAFINKAYSVTCVPQNIDMTMPYYDQQISIEYNPSNVIQENNLINLYFTDPVGGTSIILNNKIQYGIVDVILKTSVGNSIVSAFQLFSPDTLDEIDFEFVQNTALRNQKIQTVFYYKGIPLYDVNDLYIHTGIDLAFTYNKYTYVWNENYYEWKFNDKLIRRLNRNDTNTYPDSLSNIKISIWQHEPSKWSGPQTNLADGPFILSLSSISVSCPFGTSTGSPTNVSTSIPTNVSTDIPTNVSTDIPANVSTDIPTNVPTDIPTNVSTDIPTNVPTDIPTCVSTNTTSNSTMPTPTNIANISLKLPITIGCFITIFLSLLL
jgi:hypothetical protein